ncbi:MAG: MFS transporter [Actinobacteria bacterium]|nr:MFS transporter [Actinomycetota bacterium]
MTHTEASAGATKAAGVVLVTLASAQFLMALDSSVMNVSIATVAEDVGTTVTGIQTAITFYTLVMAAFMITGGKLGQILGRKRAFTIGLAVYCTGSFVTAISPNLTVLILGWSVLEGLGAALIMPAIVALVASNFPQSERPRAYGLIASAAAIAIAAGPLIGGPTSPQPRQRRLASLRWQGLPWGRTLRRRGRSWRVRAARDVVRDVRTGPRRDARRWPRRARGRPSASRPRSPRRPPRTRGRRGRG